MHPYHNEANRSQARILDGYKSGGAVTEKIAGAVHKHERHDHPGETPTPLRSGGKVAGEASKSRLDRHARGGKVRDKGPSKINIVIATGADKDKPPMMPPPMPAAMPPVMPRPAAPPPMPPAMPPGGAPPMGAPPMMRPGMYRGGKVKLDAGAGGGRARLEKADISDRVPVKAHTRRKSGGRV
jgi:hypothetical protein